MGDPASAALAVATTVAGGMARSDAAKKQVAEARRKADRDIEILERQRRWREEDRKRRLKRDLARQRARMGASGLNPNTGSAVSVLSGLAADANRQTARDNYNFDMRRDAIQTGLARAQYQNLLQRRDAQTSMFMDLTRQGTGYLKPR